MAKQQQTNAIHNNGISTMSTNKLVSAEMAAFATAFLRLLLVIATLSGHDFFPSNKHSPVIKQLSLSSHITIRGLSRLEISWATSMCEH